ncbi:MAG TPA: RHS repeat-associated core domain-containing protein, partial [Candidatus Limnocylindrales bacterium]
DTLTSFTYDPVGNRLTQVTYLGTTSYTYDAADRLASSTGPGAMAYRYDANGNELSAGTTTYGYDLADRMVAATVGATTQSYTWSGDGIRLSAATGTGAAATNFLVDRALALPSVALERDGTGALIRREAYGVSRIGLLGPSSVPTYEHTDALGSVTDLANAAGSSLAWTEYAPYGAVRSAGAVVGAPADPFGFTGEYTDAPSGLLHLRARQYDPTIGRFLSVDPVSPPRTRPYTGSYIYVGDSPLNAIDPSGRFGAEVCAGGLLLSPLGPIDWTPTVVCLVVATAASIAAGAVAQAVLDQGTQVAPPLTFVQPLPQAPLLRQNSYTGDYQPGNDVGGPRKPFDSKKAAAVLAAIVALVGAQIAGNNGDEPVVVGRAGCS